MSNKHTVFSIGCVRTMFFMHKSALPIEFKKAAAAYNSQTAENDRLSDHLKKNIVETSSTNASLLKKCLALKKVFIQKHMYVPKYTGELAKNLVICYFILYFCKF